MQISVLIATYKRPDFLKACLQSLQEQELLPVEIVIVARPDDLATLQFVAGFEGQLGSVPLRLTQVLEVGIVAAENQGLTAVSGDIIALLDDDACALPDWLKNMAEHYKNPRVGAVGGPAIPFVQGKPVLDYTQELCLRKTWYGAHIGNTEKIPLGLQQVHSLRGCNMSFRRVLVQRFDTRLLPYWRRFEDDAMLSIVRRNFIILYDPHVKVYHYTAPVQQGLSRDQDPRSILGSHHNNTYVMLKHIAWRRKIIFLFFTFMIGDATNPGLLRYLAKGLARQALRKNLHELYWALRGKALGIVTYWHWLKI